jgi:hypothetical protein
MDIFCWDARRTLLSKLHSKLDKLTSSPALCHQIFDGLIGNKRRTASLSFGNALKFFFQIAVDACAKDAGAHDAQAFKEPYSIVLQCNHSITFVKCTLPVEVILCDPNGNLLTWFIDRIARSLWAIFGDVSEERS